MATEKPLIDESSFAKATEQGRRLLARGPLARAARFAAGRVHVELDNGCAFAFPASQAEGLAGAPVADLRLIEVTAAGLGLHWPSLDADLYVPDLVKGILGAKAWMAHIGAVGGKVASKAKTRSARVNGKLGGRPRKVTNVT
jgi:hypothetical protein